MATNALRAAGYCRTSGEGQRDNTSIPRQRDEIEATCTRNGWRLVRHYVDECRSGAKTEGRDEFQRMLRDAANGEFDVLVIFDVTRLARDGVDVVSTAKVLKQSFGILTVDSKGQFDNRDHRNALRNFVAAGVSEHERLTIMERMIGGKIARAQRDNVPTSGRLPFGRTFDRTTGEWGIDQHKADVIRRIALRYVAGESLKELSKSPDCPLSYAALWRTLRYYCGDTWTLNYRIADLDWNETVTHNVPPLLDAETIEAIHARMEASRTRDHKHPSKHTYLLSGRIYCGGCGRLMTGTARPSGLLLYRHAWNTDCPYPTKPSIRAEQIENAVLRDLFDMLGNPAAIERAVRAAVPDCDDAVRERARVEAELTKIAKARNRVLDLIERDTITDSQADKKLRELRDRESALQAELDRLSQVLANVPDAAAVQCFVEQIGRAILVLDADGSTYSGGNDVMSFIDMMAEPQKRAQDGRKLIEAAFALPQPNGKPSGVYVYPIENSTYRPRQFRHKIRGRFGATQFAPSGRRRSAPR